VSPGDEPTVRSEIEDREPEGPECGLVSAATTGNADGEAVFSMADLVTVARRLRVRSRRAAPSATHPSPKPPRP